jgi:rod shape-determining protein MreD
VTPSAVFRISALLFVVAILQVSAFSTVSLFHGGPNVLLVVLVSIALLRGSVTGAVAGFAVGLIVDITTLGTLGVTSLLLTLAGYWAGRYGETTGRGRPHAPLVATVAASLLVELGGYGLYSMLGESVTPRAFLAALPATLVWNAVLAYPVYRLTRRLVGEAERVDRVREVELLV